MRKSSLCCCNQPDLPKTTVITNVKIPTERTKSISLDIIPLIWLKNTPSSALVAVADSTQHLIFMTENFNLPALLQAGKSALNQLC